MTLVTLLGTCNSAFSSEQPSLAPNFDNSNISQSTLYSQSNILANAEQNNIDKQHNDTVYAGRVGDFDVALIVDQDGQHKLQPEQEAQLQKEQALRYQKERETAQALAHKQDATTYIQAQEETISTASKDHPIDMVLTKQKLQLSMLPSAVSTTTYQQLNIELEHPKDFKESFIVAGDKLVISYTEDNSSFVISLNISPLSQEQTQDFFNFNNFKQALTERFSSKERLLFGEYKILDEQNFPARKEITLSGFLKKTDDGILPEMQNYFIERTIIDKGYLMSVNCEFKGSQAYADHTKLRFETFEPLCSRILQSYRYSFE